MPRFIAIPVAQGDAFYLESTQGSVLVDGGRSVIGFPELFRTYTKRDRVKILVATHNDADHANGVLGFLKAGLRCDEVWLPGRWAQILPTVLRPWEEIVYFLSKQVEYVDYGFEAGAPLLEQYADFICCEKLPQDTERKELDESRHWELNELGWPPVLIPQLKEAYKEDEEYAKDDFWTLEDDFYTLPWRKYWFWSIRRCPPYNPKYFLLLEAIVAANRIRQIAIEAYHRGIPVRWFEYDPKNPSGGYKWLEPINSRQIARVRPVTEEALLMMLAFTVWNKESLVFWAPPPSAGAGVLFTADSDLRGVKLPPSLKDAIVTAPHHGAKANSNVYHLIKDPVVWVRSDNRFIKRPCREFLQAQSKRLCTLCRNPLSSKQAVRLYGRAGKWVRGKGVRTCMCQ